MVRALEVLFEEQVVFRLSDGADVDGSVFIGETEFLPVEILCADKTAYRDEFKRWLNERWIPERAEEREHILSIHGNRKRFQDLLSATARKQVVPFIGSGMSAPSGLPTWSDLLRGIRRYTVVSDDALEGLISTSLFEEAADLLASAANRKLLNERIEHELRIDDQAIDGPVRLLPEVFSSLVVTTNLDDILESNYRGCNVAFHHVLVGSDLGRFRQLKDPNQRILLKLHGDCRSAAGRVLLTSEYDAAYGVGSSPREELSLIYRSNHVLFLGCSLGPDRTVQLFNEVATSDSCMPKHFAFLELPSTEKKRIEREHMLTNGGIFPIWYEGPHDQALTALLAGLLNPGEDV
ncbi:SIR2 family NAD-dependent protein deacylase [Rhodopseudomonas sp. NSM]|uniref:SIR2 family NAD-dependent protein deacylase n=1 Tax=Rhodopseudomonas sp. NSM TaxID=3457630 RepID=UPI004035235B